MPTPAKRLLPGKDLRGHFHLLPPGSHPFGSAGLWCVVRAVEDGGDHRFDAQNHRMAQSQQHKARDQQDAGTRPHPHHPNRDERNRTDNQHLLQTRKRGSASAVIGETLLWFGIHAQTIAWDVLVHFVRCTAANAPLPAVVPQSLTQKGSTASGQSCILISVHSQPDAGCCRPAEHTKTDLKDAPDP